VKKIDKWAPSARVKAFLEVYRATASVSRAARAAKIRRESHYKLLERSPSYRKIFAAAGIEAAQILEDEAVRRAVEGVKRPVLYHGELVKVHGKRLIEFEYSDSLLLALLRAKKPHEYKDRVEHGLDDATQKQAKRFTGTLQDLMAHYHDLLERKRLTDESAEQSGVVPGTPIPAAVRAGDRGMDGPAAVRRRPERGDSHR
jgi:hypothetical protein